MNTPKLDELFAASRKDLELFELERSLTEGPECEASHAAPDNLVCSEAVTHRFSFCKGVVNVCLASAEYVEESLEMNMWVCEECGRFVSDCWSVRPI